MSVFKPEPNVEAPIFVTQPTLPPLEEFMPYLEEIWASKRVANNGPFHQQFETALCEYLDVPYVSLFTNGTIALITALRALQLSGEVITTPYSFVATSHAISWNGLTPVFVDINPQTLNLDPSKIEAAITKQTTAIMPVHCYGRPCDVEEITRIADEHGLKVIYDAAHAFGVNCHCGSVLKHGDLSVLSFHATKVFNTLEGGAIICQDPETKRRIDHLKNFGFVNEVTVVATGINGKMSEVTAAFGLLQLKHFDRAVTGRRIIDRRYRERLIDVKGITCLNDEKEALTNYSYFPVLIQDDYPLSRDVLYERLKANNIYGRRYFYPLISDFPMYRSLFSAQKDNLPVATNAAHRILCLPIYPELTLGEVDSIANIIGSSY